MMPFSIYDIQKAFGCGDISSDGIRINVPGPNHSKHDRSLQIILDPKTPDGFGVDSWAGEDFAVCKDYVRKKLGLPEFAARNSGWLGSSKSPGPTAVKDKNLEGFLPSKFPLPITTAQPPAAQVPAKEYAGGYDDLPEAPHAHPMLGVPADRYEYRDHLGQILGYVCRFYGPNGKEIRPLTPWVSEKGVAWSWEGFPEPRSIYGLGRLLDRPEAPVLITEGEKAADAAQVLLPKFVAITSSGGGKAAGKTNWEPLQGRTVTIWPDQDDAGKKYAAKVAQKLHAAKAASVSCVDVTGLDEGWDLADVAPEGFDIEKRIASAKPILASAIVELPKTEAAMGDVNPIEAKPFELRDPSELPPRRWIYGKHYIRSFVSATVAPGGVGKSALTMVEALSIATGRKLLHDGPQKSCRVWLWNLEDPIDELERRIATAAIYHKISSAELSGRIFVNSGRDGNLIVARPGKSGTVICEPVVEGLITEIKRLDIGVLIVDPFVSTHMVNENDNSAISAVIQAFRSVADLGNCSVELVHHTRKPAQAGGNAPTTVEDGRGAGSFHGGVRSMRAISRMSEGDADKWDIDAEARRLYFHVHDGKPSMQPPTVKADWYRLESVDLGNAEQDWPSDNVGVVSVWTPPAPLSDVSLVDLQKIQDKIAEGGNWRKDKQAKDWVGNLVCEILGYDSSEKAHRNKVSDMLKIWTKNGALKIVDGMTEGRRETKFVVVGERAS